MFRFNLAWVRHLQWTKSLSLSFQSKKYERKEKLPVSLNSKCLSCFCPKKDRFKLRASLGCMTDSCSLYAQPWLEQFPSSCLRCVNQKPDALTARYSVCLKKIQDKLWKGCAFSNSFSKTVLIWWHAAFKAGNMAGKVLAAPQPHHPECHTAIFLRLYPWAINDGCAEISPMRPFFVPTTARGFDPWGQRWLGSSCCRV